MRLKDKTISANTGLDAIKRAPIVDYDTGLKCIRIQDISQGKEYDEWGFTRTSDKDKKKFLLKRNDLLIARTGATVGVSQFIRSDIDAVHNNGTIRLRFEKSLNPQFVYYVFQTKSFLQYIDNISCVATQPNLRIEGLLRFNIPDYSIDKQNEIVSILSSFDNLIATNNKRIKLLEQMAENLYKEWFVRFRFPGHENVKFEHGIPAGWRTYRFSQKADIMSGGTPSTEHSEYYGGEIPFYTPKDSVDSIFAFETLSYITEEGLRHCNSQLYPSNTIMITARGTVGNINLIATPMAMNQSCYAVKSDAVGSQYYLYFALKREIVKLKKMASGGVFDTIIVKTFDHIQLSVPSQEIVALFDNTVAPIMEQLQKLALQNQNLAKQRDLLLPRLMSGKLEVH